MYSRREPMANVLVACEESQRVAIAFRNKGHIAYSCDILESSGGRPDCHIKDNVLNVINGGRFYTEDGELHIVDKWDLIIAHPPCTFLANSGVHLLHKQEDRWEKMFDAAKFFNEILNADCDKICVENPIQHCHARKLIRKYDQIIHPWMFGHVVQKATCLWLKNLPKLKETNNVKDQLKSLSYKERNKLYLLRPSPDRARLRSKTFEGIAEAMAEQWGGLI